MGHVGFNRTNNRGTKKCPRCGKRTWRSLGQDEFCANCTDELEQINAHYDKVHEQYPNPMECPLCREANGGNYHL